MGRAERRHRLQTFRLGQRGRATILTSAEKVEKRATRIKEVEFDAENGPTADPIVIPAPMRRLQAGE
jgi:hypothetical protein